MTYAACASSLTGWPRSCGVMLAADHAQIHARDPGDPDSLIVVATSGCGPALVGSRVPAVGAVAAHALHSGQPVIVPGRPDHGEPAAAAAPVARDGRLTGVVSVASGASRDAFGMEKLELLCEIAELAGGSVESPAGRKALERTADDQACALATAVE